MGVFNERFKELKEEKNIMLKDLASDFEITNSKLSYYLNGNSEPPYELLIKIAKYFNVTTDYLTGMSNYKRFQDSVLANSFADKSSEASLNISEESRSVIDNHCIKLYNSMITIASTETQEDDLDDVWGVVDVWLAGLDNLVSFIDNYNKNEITLNIGKSAMDKFAFARILAGSRISKYLSEILEDDSIDENIKKMISKRTSYSIKKQKNEAIEEIEINSENHDNEQD